MYNNTYIGKYIQINIYIDFTYLLKSIYGKVSTLFNKLEQDVCHIYLCFSTQA